MERQHRPARRPSTMKSQQRTKLFSWLRLLSEGRSQERRDTQAVLSRDVARADHRDAPGQDPRTMAGGQAALLANRMDRPSSRCRISIRISWAAAFGRQTRWNREIPGSQPSFFRGTGVNRRVGSRPHRTRSVRASASGQGLRIPVSRGDWISVGKRSPVIANDARYQHRHGKWRGPRFCILLPRYVGATILLSMFPMVKRVARWSSASSSTGNSLQH